MASTDPVGAAGSGGGAGAVFFLSFVGGAAAVAAAAGAVPAVLVAEAADTACGGPALFALLPDFEADVPVAAGSVAMAVDGGLAAGAGACWLVLLAPPLLAPPPAL